MLPFSLLVSLVSLPTGVLISSYGHIRIPIRVGYCLALVGFALMTLMDERSPSALNEAVPALVGIGVGMSLQPPLILIQAAMDKSDMAASTSAFLCVPDSLALATVVLALTIASHCPSRLVRSLGATTGIVSALFARFSVPR